MKIAPAALTLLATLVSGQTFNVLHTFTGANAYTPRMSLVLSAGTLYGATESGGPEKTGTLFAINTNGNGFDLVYTFASTIGAEPYGGQLVFVSPFLYGSTVEGGPNGTGAVYAFNTNASQANVMHGFSIAPAPHYANTDGAFPYGSLILLDGYLYGTAAYGGTNGTGTVFSININGLGFNVLHTFAATSTNSAGYYTNAEGAFPSASLFFWGSNLYGTTPEGGTNGVGTIFCLNPNGSNFAVLHHFGPAPAGGDTNADGGYSVASVVVTNNTIYGAAPYFGIGGFGTLFSLGTDGSAFKVLHTFTNGADGAVPFAPPVPAGAVLYGAASGGGLGWGTVFELSTNGGAQFSVLYTFTNGADGSAPEGGLTLSGNALYGTASAGGGSYDDGTVFALAAPSTGLGISANGGNVTVTWPTLWQGYTLQSSPLLAAPAWSAVTNMAVIANSQFSVSIPMLTTNEFFRLWAQ